jgi:hypothetical protein
MSYVVVVVAIVVDEVGSEEIERKRKPKNPFEIFMERVEVVFFLLNSTMFMHEFHFNIVSSIF